MIKFRRKIGLNIYDKVNIEAYIGMLFKRVKYRQIDISQLHILQEIVNQVKPPSNTTTRKMKVPATNIIFCKFSTPLFDKRLHYHGSIRHLNFLNNSTYLDISYANYQNACFLEYPISPPGDEVKICFFAYRKLKTTE